MAVIGLAGVLGLGAFDAPARADANQTRPVPVSDLDQLADAPDARRNYQILIGELALEHGDTVAAARAYVKALQGSKDPQLARLATQIAAAAKRKDLAYQAAQAWAQTAPKDGHALRAVVQLAFVNGDVQKIETFAPRLVANEGSPRAGYKTLAQILGSEPRQADLALDVMRKVAADHPDQAAAQYALAQLALHYDQIDTAARAAEQAAAKAPHWVEANLLQAAIAVHQGKPEVAIKRVDSLQGSARKRAQYHVELARMLLEAGNEAKGLAAFKQAVVIDGDFADARLGLGLVALSQDDLDTAAKQFEWLYKAGSHADDAAFYRGVVAEKRAHDKRAIHWYKKVGGDHALEARVRVAQLSYDRGDLEGARRQLQALARQHPDHAAKLHALEGSLLERSGDPKKALAIYNQALDKAKGDPDLLYARSLTYEKLGRVDAAEADLKTILAKDADNPEALNALGYMLTNYSTDYARAERYIRKSLKAAPDNPAVLDSLGWVEYKRGHLAKARKYLEQAYQGSPDPEVAAHLGEVRWKQGDHDAARRIWQKAQSEHPHNTALKKTIKRLTS